MPTAFVDYTLTNAGEVLCARNLAGEELTFKRVAIGDGYDYDVENYGNRTELVNEVLSLTDLTMTIDSDNVVKLTAKFGSSDIRLSFWDREVGIYAVDMDDPTKEVLYAYGNANDYAQYITPDVSNYGVLKKYDCVTKVGKASIVNVIVNENQSTTDVPFDEEDWVYNSTTGMYNLPLGAVNKVIRVDKTTSEGRFRVECVDVKEDGSVSTLRALAAFDGIAVTI